VLRNQAEIVVRKARLADHPQLLRVIREYYRYDGIRYDAKSIGPALSKLLRDESLGCVWIIHHGRAHAGYVILTFNYDLEFGGLQGIVTNLFLREKFRGHGLGKAALDCVAEYAVREKYRRSNFRLRTRTRRRRDSIASSDSTNCRAS
jgi:GNAT superfamily N-acetyltransferase